VALAIERLGPAVGTKWPNDLYVAGRKIGGILCEGQHGAARGNDVVVGVGLNVNMTSEQARAIDQPATSLLIETGKESEPAELLAALLPDLAACITRWERDGFEGIRAEWMRYCVWLGSKVTVEDGGVARTGILTGFGAQGELLLRTDDDSVAALWTGDLSLRAGDGR
jgi:BirA family biotin operon repressor/biotin-[acetyl-CoA-carboxylase] ligase